MKVRLTFKPELGQLWVGSAMSTQKVLYASVAKIESQPIKGQEEYSIVRLQLGASGRCYASPVPATERIAACLPVRGMQQGQTG